MLGLFSVILFKIVSANKNTSWSTTAMFSLKLFSDTVFISLESIVIFPESISYKRFNKFTIVDFPAPVEPTIAIVSPADTLKDTPFKTGSFSTYENLTSLNPKSPFIFSIVPSPWSWIFDVVSITLKTLSAATIPICRVLNLLAIWLRGLNIIGTIMIKAVKSPNEAV